MIGLRNGGLGHIPHMKLDNAWHLKHPMPPKAIFDQRVKWHREHIKQCRGIPKKLAERMRAKGIKTP